MASPSPSVPYALLPSLQQTHLIDDDDPITVDRSIFSLSEKKLYEWKNTLKGHVGEWCVGSSHGWIILLDQNGVPLLLNSSSSTTINIPPLPLSFLHPVTYSYFAEYLRKTFIVKAILMCCSSPSSYILAIIYGSNYKIAYCNSATWVELSDDKQSYCDIVFSNNYLTKYFSVYKLDIEDKRWKKMRFLHDKVLFLGVNEFVSMDAKACLGCEANSIYFTDDRWEEMTLDYMYGGHDWGVFNLEEKCVKSMQCANRIDPPPIWIVP
ncbi:hypothetical protein HN51_054057 [Arachis hypogaea]